MRSRKSARRAGFTILELVVTLLLIGVAASMVAPALRPPESDAGGAAAELAAVYGRARGVAAARFVVARVDVDLATGAYTLTAWAAPEGGVDTVLTGRLRLPEETTLGGPDRTAVALFTPDGRSRADRITILAGDQSHDIETDPWTGRVAVRIR